MASEMRRRQTMTAGQPPLVVIPGTDAVVAAVTAVLPAAQPGPSGLRRARLTDLSGGYLYWGWIPAGARLVMRGQRVFMHWQGNEWRQQPVVELTEQGRPA